MNTRFYILRLAALFLALSVGACSGGGLEKKVVEFKLKNGMKWLLVKRGYAPVFAGIVQVKAGGVDETLGKTGLAHLLEHMAFKGTSKIGTSDFEEESSIMAKMDEAAEAGNWDEVSRLMEEQKKYIVPSELWDIFVRNGAKNLNAYTNKDVTAYHVEMPSTKLELWMYLMSGMLKDPAFREFYKEREVVLEEYRMSQETDPSGLLFTKLLETAYREGPYSWSTIGRKEDIQSLKRQDLIKFHDALYTAECMVGAIVGDIDIKETEALLEKYFGDIKGGGYNALCKRDLPPIPKQEGYREEKVTFDAEPLVAFAFHKPKPPAFDDYVFDMLQVILCEGNSSRLTERLVKDLKLAKTVECSNSYPGARMDNLFVIYVEPLKAEDIGRIKDVVNEELEKIKRDSVRQDEIKMAKNKIKTDFLLDLDSNFELGHTLVYFENITGSWRYVLDHEKMLDKIKRKDISSVAARYFVPENTTVVTLERGSK